MTNLLAPLHRYSLSDQALRSEVTVQRKPLYYSDPVSNHYHPTVSRHPARDYDLAIHNREDRHPGLDIRVLDIDSGMVAAKALRLHRRIGGSDELAKLLLGNPLPELCHGREEPLLDHRRGFNCRLLLLPTGRSRGWLISL